MSYLHIVFFSFLKQGKQAAINQLPLIADSFRHPIFVFVRSKVYISVLSNSSLINC